MTMDPLDYQPDVVAPARKHIRRKRDDRLPAPGTRLTRVYKGHEYQVEVLSNGFAYEGERYQSLSAVAHAITGGHWNGFLFFGLTDPKRWNFPASHADENLEPSEKDRLHCPRGIG